MNDDELDTFTRLLDQAETPEEKCRIREQWLPHLSRCLISTNRHIKAVEEAIAEMKNHIHEIDAKLSRISAIPKWKEDKIGWLKANWMWCVILAYVLQNLFGIDIATIVQQAIKP